MAQKLRYSITRNFCTFKERLGAGHGGRTYVRCDPVRALAERCFFPRRAKKGFLFVVWVQKSEVCSPKMVYFFSYKKIFYTRRAKKGLLFVVWVHKSDTSHGLPSYGQTNFSHIIFGRENSVSKKKLDVRTYDEPYGDTKFW
jgi:hypothetical protein